MIRLSVKLRFLAGVARRIAVARVHHPAEGHGVGVLVLLGGQGDSAIGIDGAGRGCGLRRGLGVGGGVIGRLGGDDVARGGGVRRIAGGARRAETMTPARDLG